MAVEPRQFPNNNESFGRQRKNSTFYVTLVDAFDTLLKSKKNRPQNKLLKYRES